MMNEHDHNDDLIGQYLLGQLEGDVLEKFKERLASDEIFRNEVALQKAMIQNIKAVGRNEWKEKLQYMHNNLNILSDETGEEMTVSKQLASVKSFYQNKYFLWAAASVILIVVSTLLIVSNNNGQNTDHIFVAYYQPYPDLEPGTRSLTTKDSTLRKQAFNAYNAGDFLESIRLFSAVLNKGEDEIVLFYLGNAFLSADKPAEAESIFKQYLNKYTEFAPDSKWYLSLSYLKQNKIKDARKLLEEVAVGNNNYSIKAEEILSKL